MNLPAKNGHFTLTMMSPRKVGLPYGSIPRLLVSWVTMEAVRTRCPVLGPTLVGVHGGIGLGAARGRKRLTVTEKLVGLNDLSSK